MPNARVSRQIEKPKDKRRYRLCIRKERKLLYVRKERKCIIVPFCGPALSVDRRILENVFFQ